MIEGLDEFIEELTVQTNSRIALAVKGTVEGCVAAERKRCVDIINLARTGDIDTDLRAIRSRIQGGDSAESIAAERAAG